MSKFDDFKNAIVDGAQALATSTLSGLGAQAGSDARDFLRRTDAKLERWTKMLAKGDLTKLEFKTLVESQEGLAALNALTQAGIAAAALQRFRDGLIDLVVKSAVKTFL